MYFDKFDHIKAYELMFLIREVENNLLDLIKAGKVLGTTHACIGQESIPVGVAFSRREGDVVFSNHRGHGHMLSCGVSPSEFFDELLGKESGICGGRGGSQHIMKRSVGFMGSNGITGGQVPVAVGYALGLKLKGLNNKAIVFLGDGAFNQGAVAEALNLAAVKSAPVVFVCEDNKYGMSSPARDFVSGSILDRAASFGIDVFTADAEDVEDIHSIASYALSIPGPAFIYCDTYRFCGHSKSDMCVYRTKKELSDAKSRDPIKFWRKVLLNRGVDNDFILNLELSVSNRIKETVEKCLENLYV